MEVGEETVSLREQESREQITVEPKESETEFIRMRTHHHGLKSSFLIHTLGTH